MPKEDCRATMLNNDKNGLILESREPLTCLEIYGQKSRQSVHEHVVQNPAFQLDLEESVFPSSLPALPV